MFGFVFSLPNPLTEQKMQIMVISINLLEIVHTRWTANSIQMIYEPLFPSDDFLNWDLFDELESNSVCMRDKQLLHNMNTFTGVGP